MSDDLAATVAALKDGDLVRATGTDYAGRPFAVEGIYVKHYNRIDAGGASLHFGGFMSGVTAVEVLDPVLPPEPPVGSGVFHDGVLWVRVYAHDDNPWRSSAGRWSKWCSWADIQPCVPAVPDPMLDSLPLPPAHNADEDDEPDVPVGSLAVFRSQRGNPITFWKFDNGTWSGNPWPQRYGAPVAVIPAGGE